MAAEATPVAVAIPCPAPLMLPQLAQAVSNGHSSTAHALPFNAEPAISGSSDQPSSGEADPAAAVGDLEAALYLPGGKSAVQLLHEFYARHKGEDARGIQGQGRKLEEERGSELG